MKPIDRIFSKVKDAPSPARPNLQHPLWNWLGVLPFLCFTIAFLVLPASSLFMGTFQDASGHFTFQNVFNLLRPNILNAYLLTIQISLVTALGGAFFGFLLAYAITSGGLPHNARTFVLTFCGVASNFAGVPLAFAFISTLGRVGLVTVLLKTVFHLDIYAGGFNLYGFWGLSLTYLYFQLPLMILMITPALDGLKKEWREATENLGGSAWHYWRYVALPVLAPSILATVILLFGNSFGAYATAYALTGGLLNLVPILIGAQIRGDVLHDPNLGYALAFGMVLVMSVSILGYTWLQRLAQRRMA